MDEHEYLLRFAATDWDPEIARRINGYLRSIEPDAEGTQPSAFVDQPASHTLGVHIFPLNLYSKQRRDEIILECARIWDSTIQGPAAPTSRR